MSLDDVARVLAEPMPRRRAVRVIGGAVIGVAFGGFWTRGARAQQGECLPGHSPCITSPNLVCCNDLTEDCVPGPLHICRNKPTPCPAGTTHCGGRYDFDCCRPGFDCENSVCVPGCPPGSKKCGRTCCGRDQQCSGGRCVKACPRGRAVCGKKCCPKGQRCVNASTGLCTPCKKGQTSCGKKCCPKGTFCCNPARGICCKKSGGECCFTNPNDMQASGVCCQSPSNCAREGDLEGANVPGGGTICCPPSRQAPNSACCPPGSTAHKVLKVGVGIPLACCPNDRFCGEECMARAPGAGVFEQCCDGVPRNTHSDPRNCGACGNVCAEGQGCFSGICA